MNATAGARDAVLDQAALHLVTAAAEDTQGLERVRELLAPLVADAAEPQWVRQALTTGVELLDTAIGGALAQENAVARVGALIELVMRGEQAATRTEANSEYALPLEMVQELFPEFLAECFDYLEQVEAALLHLQAEASDDEAVNLVFRAFHTIKSTSAALGLRDVSGLAHNAESVLGQLRDAGAGVSTVHAGLIMQCTDMMRELLGLAELAVLGAPAAVPAGYAALLGRLAAAEACGVEATAAGALPLDSTELAAAPPVQTEVRASHPAVGANARTMRVRTERLDQLIELIGELVVAQSMTAQDELVLQHRHTPLARKVAHAGKIVRELQQLGMALRMVPLRPLFQRMERLVRDVAQQSGRQVAFVTHGEDTEIDRNMVDLVADPLMHMIRNAIDHGIEPEHERAATGKEAVGTLKLSAWHSGGDVIVQLQDDGRGLDHERIHARAIERGLVERERVLTRSEIGNLIFEPGLSTAESVSEVSGRGVGMDVVKRNIEALRGRIEVESVTGQGTTFTLRLPLTLAITEGMLVRVGGERYIVPTSDIHTSFRPAADALTTVAGAGELVSLHGAILPIVRLHAHFALDDAEQDPARAVLVVVGQGADRCALLVDELLGQQQFVARPVGEGLGTVHGLAGAAVLGDGRVGLILDTAAILASR